MKKWIAKIMAFVLMFSIAGLSATVLQPGVVASAASVDLTTTSKSLVVGNTYTVSIKDKTNVLKTSWRSSDTEIASVNAKGVVTAVGAGTATITCTATLKSGKTQKLNCKIISRRHVSAKAVSLNYVHGDLNAHIIAVGDRYDFNTTLTPSNATDKTYYSIADSDIASVSSAGVVTAKKPGITVLEARVGHSYSYAMRRTNKVVAKTYILVPPKTATIPTPSVSPTPSPSVTPTPTPANTPKALDVTLVSSKEIKVTFNAEIKKSSVIDSNGDLIDGVIAVTQGRHAKSVGTLSAKLSEDLKELHLTATGEFEGTYVISVFNKILTVDNQIIPTAAFQRDFKDLIGPMYLGTEVDETGYICRINFNEAIDISNLSITSVNGTNVSSIKSYLTTPSSYTLSEDKKSLEINLSGIGYKEFSALVNMIGIRDIKGNIPPQFQISVLVRCDATEKPLANIIHVERVSKTLMVATFDRAIQYPGVAIIGSDFCNGVVNPENHKQVNYTINNTEVTGLKLVEFSGFLNYNAVYTTNNKVTRYVDFTLDTTAPKVVSHEFTMTTEYGNPIHKLTLTYDKKISVVNGSGSLSTLVNSTNGIIVRKDFAYTATANDKTLVLTFNNQSFAPGNYAFTLPTGLVVDTLGNMSMTQVINVYKQAGSSAALPAPISVVQDASNPSKILITFANKLDIASAQTTTNYSLNGNVVPISAAIKEQTEVSATVELTFAPGAIETTTTHAISVIGIKGYNDSYGEMKAYYTMITLIENCAPVLKRCELNSAYSVQITFNENITGSGVFQMIGKSGIVNIDSMYISNNTIYLTLPEAVTSESVCIIVKSNHITDVNNNVVELPAQIVAVERD